MPSLWRLRALAGLMIITWCFEHGSRYEIKSMASIKAFTSLELPWWMSQKRPSSPLMSAIPPSSMFFLTNREKYLFRFQRVVRPVSARKFRMHSGPELIGSSILIEEPRNCSFAAKYRWVTSILIKMATRYWLAALISI